MSNSAGSAPAALMACRIEIVSRGLVLTLASACTRSATVLVPGSVCDRTYWSPVLPALVQHFTVISPDRRGRGGSGDAEPYAIEREFDDIAAVVAVAHPRGAIVKVILENAYLNDE